VHWRTILAVAATYQNQKPFKIKPTGFHPGFAAAQQPQCQLNQDATFMGYIYLTPLRISPIHPFGLAGRAC
jgi:hypothetical protein